MASIASGRGDDDFSSDSDEEAAALFEAEAAGLPAASVLAEFAGRARAAEARAAQSAAAAAAQAEAERLAKLRRKVWRDRFKRAMA
eukprot:COSAG04_NODE_1227_length_7681_cov_5.724083_1_plen_85_part_10